MYIKLQNLEKSEIKGLSTIHGSEVKLLLIRNLKWYSYFIKK